MRTVRRLFYVDIVTAVVFVALAFLSLSFFIDFVDELADVGQRGYTAVHAALYTLLLVPGHIYEVAPIAGRPQSGRVADDGKAAGSGHGQLRDKGVGQILRVAIVVGEPGLVVELRDSDRVGGTRRSPRVAKDHRGDDQERQRG